MKFTITAPRNVIAAIGTILRDRVEDLDSVETLNLEVDDWTLIEEIATGMENA